MNTDWLKELAIQRELLARAKNNVIECQKELEETNAYKALQVYKDKLNILQESVDETTNQIKKWVLKEFDGKNKKPYSGVEIRNFTIVNVLDEKQAKVWAAENAPSTLNISKSKFEKVVKVLELDFIQLGEENRVYLASDLSEYLEK